MKNTIDVLKTLELKGEAERALEIYQHSMHDYPLGIDIETIPDEPVYIAARFIDAVVDNDSTNNDGNISKWPDVYEMANAYLRKPFLDEETGETHTREFDSEIEGTQIAQEIFKLTGHLN